MRGIQHEDKIGIFTGQWECFEHVLDSEILKCKKVVYLHSKIHSLTLDLLYTAVFNTVFLR